MTRSQIIADFKRAGIPAELTADGFIVNGKSIRHDDRTGVSECGANRFRAKDLYELQNFLYFDGK